MIESNVENHQIIMSFLKISALLYLQKNNKHENSYFKNACRLFYKQESSKCE